MRKSTVWMAFILFSAACDYGLESQEQDLGRGPVPASSATVPAAADVTVAAEEDGCEEDETDPPYIPRHDFEADIDKHGFNFNYDKEKISTDPNVVATGEIGEVDGPWSHNGTFKIYKDGTLEIKVGTNEAHDNDLDLTVKLDGNTLTVNGTVYKGDKDDEARLNNAKTEIKGKGTTSKPWSGAFVDDKEKSHSIKWWDPAKEEPKCDPGATLSALVTEE